MNIRGTQTEKNLLIAFTGESQARNRYEFGAKVAKKEGYVQIANYFTLFASHERSHAKSFYKLLEGTRQTLTMDLPPMHLGETLENLREAADGEREEHTRLYPGFGSVARAEGATEAAVLFNAIAKAEQHHESVFRHFIEQIEQNTMFHREESVSWICSKCGLVHTGTDALKKCPGCGHPQSYFEVLNELL